MTELRTQRLILRPWRDDDLDHFAALNCDPQVMTHFPSTLSRAKSDAVAARHRDHFDRHGFGFWVVEVPDEVPFIGCIGLLVTRFQAHFTPCVEIGWRLMPQWWGQGLATEAAQAAVTFGFETLDLDELVAFTVPANIASQRVMRRLGMTHNLADDFDHPLVPPGSPQQRHVLYRLRKQERFAQMWEPVLRNKTI